VLGVSVGVCGCVYLLYYKFNHVVCLWDVGVDVCQCISVTVSIVILYCELVLCVCGYECVGAWVCLCDKPIPVAYISFENCPCHVERLLADGCYITCG
jgi:hypothetical protein